MSRMIFVTALMLPILPFTWAVCEEECSATYSLLSSCNLDPLSTDADELEERGSQSRNVTGMEDSEYHTTQGPPSFLITSLSQAECFCTDATPEYERCDSCLFYEWFSSEAVSDNGQRVHYLYGKDCSNFGYFANETAAYPSTTRTAMPEATSPTDDDTSCNDVCGLVDSQAAECDLLPLDAEYDGSERDIIIVSAENGSYNGLVLANRTAAECLCTGPVLSRLEPCHWCKGGSLGESAVLVGDYRQDCSALGYWPTRSLVEPDEFGETEEEGGGTLPPPGSSDTDQADEPDGAGRTGSSVRVGIISIATCTVTVILLL